MQLTGQRHDPNSMPSGRSSAKGARRGLGALLAAACAFAGVLTQTGVAQAAGSAPACSGLSLSIASARRVDTVIVNGLFHGYRDVAGACEPYRAPGTAYLQRYLDGAWQNMIAIKHSGFVSAAIYRQPKVFEYRWVDVTPAQTRTSTVTFR